MEISNQCDSRGCKNDAERVVTYVSRYRRYAAEESETATRQLCIKHTTNFMKRHSVTIQDFIKKKIACPKCGNEFITGWKHLGSSYSFNECLGGCGYKSTDENEFIQEVSE